MKRILFLVSLLFLTACATDTATLTAIADIQSKQRATLLVTCPAGGCSVEYTDPRDKVFKLPTNGWDAFVSVSNNVTGLVSGAVVPGILGAVAVQGYKAVRDAGQGGNTQVINTTNTSTSIVASGNGASTGGTANYEQIGPDSNNSQSTSSVVEDNSTISTTSNTTTSNTTTTDNSYSDSNNVDDNSTITQPATPAIPTI